MGDDVEGGVSSSFHHSLLQKKPVVLELNAHIFCHNSIKHLSRVGYSLSFYELCSVQAGLIILMFPSLKKVMQIKILNALFF